MKTKRLGSALLTLALLFTLAPALGGSARAVLASGTVGTLNWSLADDGTLTISGTGAARYRLFLLDSACKPLCEAWHN